MANSEHWRNNRPRDYYRSFQISKNISNLSQLLIISKKNVHLPLVSKQTAHEEHNSKYLILGRPFLFLSYIEIRICICEFHDWLSSCVCQVRELITANCFQQKFNGPWKTPRFAFKGKTLPCLLESDRQHGHHDLNHKMHVEMNSSFCFDACLAIDAVLKWKMIDAIPLLSWRAAYFYTRNRVIHFSSNFWNVNDIDRFMVS